MLIYPWRSFWNEFTTREPTAENSRKTLFAHDVLLNNESKTHMNTQYKSFAETKCRIRHRALNTHYFFRIDCRDLDISSSCNEWVKPAVFLRCNVNDRTNITAWKMTGVIENVYTHVWWYPGERSISYFVTEGKK